MARQPKNNHRTEDQRLLVAPCDQPENFTDTDPWRVMRVMSEFVQGFDALAELGPAITIFGSARVKPDNTQYQQAVETARLLGEAGFNIITGGGPGIMQAGNEGAKKANVTSVGLNIELPFEQHLNPFVDIAVDYRYFFVRKTMLVKYAQGFVIFPGGFGTMDELFEALTLIQTGKIQNFPIVLFDSSYWEGLLGWLRGTMLREGKVSASDLDLLIVADSPTEVRDIIITALQGESDQAEKEAAVRAILQQVYHGH
ncbi:MAG: TIGR00730 family Rossman fold protein [Anaerolineales bacterium]|nr:TIGR00730 family Rossman fold protein [Anaerolineales bacterium]